MKISKKISFIALLAISITSCQKQNLLEPTSAIDENNSQALSSSSNKNEDDDDEKQNVYTLSNQTTGNSVVVYNATANGSLSLSGSFATGGTGTGGGLGNQGAVILTDKKMLLAVNAGSNSISLFKVKDNGLELKSTVNSGGMRPVSITQNKGIVYVLNAGGTGNISGFKINDDVLQPISNSTRPLSSTMAGAAQIEFVQKGKVVVVTEKATNKIITYTINENGLPGMQHSITSSTNTPFGFASTKAGTIFVSEAAGGAAGASKLSSYKVDADGTITLATGSVGANQSAACWVVITKNNKYAYATNTASNNISNFNVDINSGGINVNTAIAATTGMGPIDAALNNNSKFLYILNTTSHTIGVYAVAPNGNLSLTHTMSGVPVGATGLAAN